MKALKHSHSMNSCWNSKQAFLARFILIRGEKQKIENREMMLVVVSFLRTVLMFLKMVVTRQCVLKFSAMVSVWIKV